MNRLGPILLTAVILMSACREKPEVLSVDEAMTAVPSMIFQAQSPFEGKEVSSFYRLSESSEGIIDTYFTIESLDGTMIRLAKLRYCAACALIGSSTELENSSSVYVTGSINQEVNVCRITEEAYRAEVFSGDQYNTCLYWIDDEGHGYKLYSTWELKETVEFLENLEPLNQ
jgi:hypothetical protein